MLVYYIFALAGAIEGGYSIPSVGFTDLHSGVMCAIVVTHDLRIIDAGVRGQVGYYPGRNPGYTMTTYGVHWFITKHAWRVSPVLDIGADYTYRSLHGNSEKGWALIYGIGMVINIPAQRMRVYPTFFYEGITDGARHGGFIGMKLGVAYEF